jgi:hypothetical protein
MSALVVFVGSVFILSTSTAASAAVTQQYAYTCSGGLFSNTSINVTLSAPDSVTAGSSFDLSVGIPALTLTTNPQTATTVQVTATLSPAATDAGAKTGAAVTAGQTAVPAGTATYKIAVAAGTTSSVSVKPTELKLALASAPTNVTTCATTSTSSLVVPIGTGGTGTDLVDYECVGPATTDVQDVQIKVEMTMPTSAKVSEQFTIKWKGTYTAGQELKAPTTGGTISAKIFAYASLTGITGLTSATGEGTTGTITAGAIIPLPTTTIDLKSTASTAGTATVKPGKVNFGSNTGTSTTTTPAIVCTVQNETELKSYSLTVGAASTSTGTPTSTPTSTPTTSSPKPTKTSTATVTVTPPSKSKTPKAGADTGAGGDAGPDGRTFIVTGTALIAAAAVGGLVMRRRTVRG